MYLPLAVTCRHSNFPTQYVVYDPHKKTPIFTVKNTGMEAEFAFGELKKSTKFRRLAFLVG